MNGGPFTSSLVICGTGMLAEATCWLASRSASTLVVARRASRFAVGQNGVIGIDADWHEPAFQTTIQSMLD